MAADHANQRRSMEIAVLTCTYFTGILRSGDIHFADINSTF